MSQEETIISLLKSHNLKNTTARRKILQSFTSSSAALSHPYLEEKHGDEFDRVTIYRTLKSFEQKGVIHEVIDDGSLIKYALCHDHCEEGHHHDSHLHFKCEKCGETVCLETPVPEFEILKKYQVSKVSVLAQGICRNCAA